MSTISFASSKPCQLNIHEATVWAIGDVIDRFHCVPDTRNCSMPRLNRLETFELRGLRESTHHQHGDYH